MGISPLTAREIAYRALGTDTEINYENDKKVADEFFKVFKKIEKGEFSPVVLTDAQSGKMLEFSAIDINQYGEMAEKEYFESMSLALESFYEKKAAKESVKQKTADITKVISNNLARCRKKLQLECETLEKCKKRELNKVKGDLITANIYRINKGDKKAVLENFYDGGKVIEIALDETLTPPQNAQKYYKNTTRRKPPRRKRLFRKNSTRRKSTILKRFCSIWKTSKQKRKSRRLKRSLSSRDTLKSAI